MPWKGPEYPGDFPSLGYLIADWAAAHCVIPDGFKAGDPYVLTDEQLTFFAHHYRLKLDALPASATIKVSAAFVYRRSQLVRPQKWGKGPMTACQVCAEGVGPAVFAGWAVGGEVWDCRYHGCDCGWVYEYEPGEPMGKTWPTPLIQITATSEEQTDNVYDALRPMIDNGPLHQVIPKTGEEFIRLPGDGRIDVVTSNARSRLGQRVTFVPQDETGLWTPSTGMVKVAEVQRRGLAGMGGRAVETTNAWDPAEGSVAQRTYDTKRPDVYKDHLLPPAGLSYRNKQERRKIHKAVYAGSWWVDIDAIEGEAAELMETDVAQAERFFGNRLRPAEAAVFDTERWAELADPILSIPNDSLVVVGVDGARFFDAVALVATEVESGHQWPLGIWERPESAEDDYEHPADEIDGAMIEVFDLHQVWRVYIDPQYIDHLVDRWTGRWGEHKIIPWYTNRPRQIAHAVRSYKSAQSSGGLSNDGDPDMARHIANARKKPLNVKDDKGRPMFAMQKEFPSSNLKIDAAMAGTLSWECRGDAIAAGARKREKKRAVFV